MIVLRIVFLCEETPRGAQAGTGKERRSQQQSFQPQVPPGRPEHPR